MFKNISAKKTFLTFTVCIAFLCSAVATLQSTSFKRIYKDNKVVVSMKPIYSSGDAIKYSKKHDVTAYKAPQKINQLRNKNVKVYYPKPTKAALSTLRAQQKKIVIRKAPLNKGLFSAKPQKLAHKNPMTIIPNYVSARNKFSRYYVASRNSYLSKQAYLPKAKIYQGRIPASGAKHMKPMKTAGSRQKQYVYIPKR